MIRRMVSITRYQQAWRASAVLLLAFLTAGVLSDDPGCATLGGECSAHGNLCCNFQHDCIDGKCVVAGYVPTHGESCNEQCNLPCATHGESCVKGICRGAEEECAEIGEDCSVEKGCCDPDHDCVPVSDSPLPPVWEHPGTCQKTTLAATGKPCNADTPCRFSFDTCVDGMCRVDPTTLLDAGDVTEVKAKASAHDDTPALRGGCGVNMGCNASRTRDGKIREDSRWSCRESMGRGKCTLEYSFGKAIDIIDLSIAFHEGDKGNEQILRVFSNGKPLGKIKSNGRTTELQTWMINATKVQMITLEAFDLEPDEWLHISEVKLLTRNLVGC